MPVNPALKYQVKQIASGNWQVVYVRDDGTLGVVEIVRNQAEAIWLRDALDAAYQQGRADGHAEESAARDRIAERTCQKCSKVVGWSDGWEYHPGLWMHYDCTPPQFKD